MTQDSDDNETPVNVPPYQIGSTVWNGLSKLIEECGEVNQVAGKILGCGGHEIHFDGSNLRTRLEEEMGDVLAAIEFVTVNNELSKNRIMSQYSKKLKQFITWHYEQSDVAYALAADMAKRTATHADGSNDEKGETDGPATTH